MSETFPVIVENAGPALASQIRQRVHSSAAACTASTSIARIRFRASRSARCGASARARAGGVALEIREFHRPIAWHSPLHSIYELECTINFPAGAVTTRDLIPVRYTTPSTLELAALASGMFKMVAAYCDLSFTKPLDKCRYRWMGVLRRV